MVRPRLLTGVCFGVASLFIQPTFGPSQAVETPLSPAAQEDARILDGLPATHVPHVRKPPLDRSGRAKFGKASFYASRYDHRKMADGKRFSVAGDAAASKSLPLGTTAKVVSLESGKSAIIKVEDRGPYVGDRVLDVSPKVADRLGMKKAGVISILVRPIAVPQADGSVKLGAGAADASPQQVRDAVRTTERLAWQQGR